MRFKKAKNVVESEALYVRRMGLLRDNFMNRSGGYLLGDIVGWAIGQWAVGQGLYGAIG